MATQHVRTGAINVGGREYTIYPFDHLRSELPLDRLPYSLRILLEDLLRHGREEYVTDSHIVALAGWDPGAEPAQEIAFVPARVLLQDFTGVPRNGG